MPGAFANYKHLLLLAALLVALVTQPLAAGKHVVARTAYDLFLGGVLVVMLFVVFEARWERWTATALALPAMALTVALNMAAPQLTVPAAVAYHISLAAFIGFAVAVIVRDIFRHRAISFDEIVGAFAGYLLLGIMWGSLYVLVELFAPGSFAVSPDIRWQLDDVHLRRALFNYLSFATMASLGYNDITAVAPVANTLTWLEVMTSQFYLAVVIAQLVGIKLMHMVGGPGAR